MSHDPHPFREHRQRQWSDAASAIERVRTPEPNSLAFGGRSVRQLLADHPELRPAILEGLLREGETMNIIAPPKTGKSWLVLSLGIAIATGGRWLGTFPAVQGGVLIIDNELHGETIASRIPRVARAMGVPLEDIADSVFVESLRGNLRDLLALEPYFGSIEPGRFRVIIIDAFYRVMPREMDENDNGTMATIYNCLDRYAAKLGCAFILIHHAAKGNQSAKAVTDVGAGAGAQSRATDTHLVLRQHEEDKVVVLDAAVRSWPPIDPVCLRWEFPLWKPDGTLDPALLKPERKRRAAAAKDQGAAKPPPRVWTAAEFAKSFIASTPALEAAIVLKANAAGVPKATAKSLVAVAVDEGRAFKWQLGPSDKVRYASVEQPLTAAAVAKGEGGGIHAPPTPPRGRQSGPGAGAGAQGGRGRKRTTKTGSGGGNP